MSEKIISCALHDYIEIACLYGYQVRLDLTSGESIEGKAIDIETSPDKREFMILKHRFEQKVDLTQLVKMHILTPNAKFKEISFQ